jgi:hypothetical protein
MYVFPILAAETCCFYVYSVELTASQKLESFELVLKKLLVQVYGSCVMNIKGLVQVQV